MEDIYMIRYLFILLLFCVALPGSAQVYMLAGKITDQHDKPVGFASVYIRNSTYGSAANENGSYQFKLERGTYDVIYRSVGYVEKVERITITDHDVQHNVKLENENFQLKAVTVQATNDDAAVDVIKQAIAKRKYYLNEVNSYSCAVYIKGMQRLIKAPRKLMGKDVTHILQLDTAGHGILYQSESLSSFNYEQPNKVKELVISSKLAGESTAFSYNKASDLKANFYKNMLQIDGLSARGFISPIADNALQYYNYKLLGVSVENGHTIDQIQLLPKRKHDPVYQGFIYILEGDWRLYSVDLYLTKDDNYLNLVDTLKISQQFVPVQDNYWMPEAIHYNFKGEVLGFAFQGYYIAVYNNYKINQQFPKGFFDGEVMRVDTGANHKSNAYWAQTRPVPLTPQELHDFHFKDSLEAVQTAPKYLDSVEQAHNQFNWLPYTVFGYTHHDRKNLESWYLHPFYQTIYYNTVEGWGVNLKADYTRGLQDGTSFTITPNVRYGFANKQFQTNVHATYNFDPRHQGYWFTSFGTDILDLSNVGTRTLFFNTLSTLLSENNYVKYYRARYGLVAYQRELANGILWFASLSYSDRQQLYNISYNHISTTDGKHYTSNNPLAPDNAPPDDRSFLFPENQALTFKTSLTFTFDQQYIDRPDGRFYEPNVYPKVKVNYRQGINGLLGSDVKYNFGSLDIYDDRLTFGLLGYSAYRITFGDFFNNSKMYFMDYNHFLGNQGTVFDPTIGGFHYLPFYTFSTNSSFIEAHYEHDFGGFIFHKVPLLRTLKLEELVGVNYLTEQTGRQNYTEYYIGIKRFFFRVDYGVAYSGNKKVSNGIRIFYGIK